MILKASIFGIVCFAAGAGLALSYAENRPRTVLANFAPLQEELELIREELVNVQASKCLVINTPSLDIYQVPNLGAKKVAKP